MKFKYRNYRGKIADRRAIPIWLFFGKNKYHKKLTWLLLAWDLDKSAFRTFNTHDFIN